MSLWECPVRFFPDPVDGGGDIAPPAGGEPGPAAAPEPAFRVPEGHRLVRDDEWQTVSRTAEQGRGAQKMFQRFSQHGLDESVFENEDILKLVGSLSKTQDVRPADIYEALFGENGELAAKQREPVGNLTQADIDRLIQERAGRLFDEKFGSERKRLEAQRDHDRAASAEQERMKKFHEKFEIPDDPGDDPTGKLLHATMLGLRALNGNVYPDDHPLAGTFSPLSPDVYDQMEELFSGGMEGLKAKLLMAQAKGGKPTVGGRTDRVAAPSKSNTGDDALSDEDRSQQLHDLMVKLQNERAAKTRSSA